MKRYFCLLGFLVGLVGVSVFFIARRGGAPTDSPQRAPVALADHGSVPVQPPLETSLASPAPSKAPEPAETKLSSDTGRPRHAKIVIKAGEPIPELFPFQAERERLYNLALGDDPARFAAIASHFNHSDARVREAARLALIQTGDRAAVPHLENAIKDAANPDEAKLLLEAVEFLSLPRFLDVIAAQAHQARESQGADRSPPR